MNLIWRIYSLLILLKALSPKVLKNLKIKNLDFHIEITAP